jgi:hypothetical protein
MKDKEFRAMLDLVMCCDPWPVEMDMGLNEAIIKDMVLLESVKRNYPNWVDAYHNFEVK